MILAPHALLSVAGKVGAGDVMMLALLSPKRLASASLYDLVAVG